MCLGIPGLVEAVWDRDDGARMGRVAFGGEVTTLCLACLPDLTVGDWVLGHAGYALTRLDPDDARATLATMADLGLLEPVGPAVGTGGRP